MVHGVVELYEKTKDVRKIVDQRWIAFVKKCVSELAISVELGKNTF